MIGSLIAGIIQGVSNTAISAANTALAAQQDKWNRDFQEKQFDFNKQQTQWENQFAQDVFDFNKDNTLFNQDLQNKTFELNAQNQAFNQGMQQQSFDYQKYANENKYQIAVQDAQKAGLNPLAMMGMSAGSASVSNVSGMSAGSSPSASAPSGGNGSALGSVMAQLPGVLSSVLQTKASLEAAWLQAKTQKDIAKIQADTQRYSADTAADASAYSADTSAASAAYVADTHRSATWDVAVSNFEGLVQKIESDEKIARGKNASAEKMNLDNIQSSEFIALQKQAAEILMWSKEFMRDTQFKAFEAQITGAKTIADLQKVSQEIKSMKVNDNVQISRETRSWFKDFSDSARGWFSTLKIFGK